MHVRIRLIFETSSATKKVSGKNDNSRRKTTKIEPHLGTGLPDGMFSNKNTNLGKIVEGIVMEDVGIHILRPFDLFYVHLICFTSI
jgi:hypothetical protein